MILCFMAIVSAGSSEFSDPSSGVRLTNYWRVATIRFTEEEENKCPRRNCRVHDRFEGDKSRAVRKMSNISAIRGAEMVKDKIPQRLIALEDGGNGKSSFDADDVLANEAWEVDVLFGVVAGVGSGKDHQVRLLKQLLIRPNANTACGDHAGDA